MVRDIKTHKSNAMFATNSKMKCTCNVTYRYSTDLKISNVSIAIKQEKTGQIKKDQLLVLFQRWCH
jgi:hypothetical protein